MSNGFPLASQVASLVARAAEHGIVLDVDITPTHLTLMDFHRDPNTPKGQGFLWLKRLTALALEFRLPIQLICTAWNDALITYYGKAGFHVAHIHEDDAILHYIPSSIHG